MATAFPPGPAAEAATLAYAAPLVARLTLIRDGLLGGIPSMAHRSFVLHPTVTGSINKLALFDGHQPSDTTTKLAATYTEMIERARTWAVGQLAEIRGIGRETAERTFDAHVAWNIAASMGDAEIQLLTQFDQDEDA